MENLSQFVESCDKLAHIIQDVFQKSGEKVMGITKIKIQSKDVDLYKNGFYDIFCEA